MWFNYIIDPGKFKVQHLSFTHFFYTYILDFAGGREDSVGLGYDPNRFNVTTNVSLDIVPMNCITVGMQCEE